MEGAVSIFLSDGSSYKPFTEKVTSLLLSRTPCEKNIRYVLGGGALAATEELMSYSLRSQYGVFFTPEDITRSAVEHFRHEIESSASFYDPACGAGNLLLGIAKEYKLGRTLVDTVRLWGEAFGGCDINPDFVEAAKLRLIFLAAYRHGLPEISAELLGDLITLFSNFKVANFLEVGGSEEYDCILINPPFSHVNAAKECEWAQGKTQLAAIFISKLIQLSKRRQSIFAILPDVLRSGTRYKKWRALIERHSQGGQSRIYGRFSKNVDVDVFFLSFDAGVQCEEVANIHWVAQRPWQENQVKLSDFYKVSVGPVVPFRLSGNGETVSYITARDCPPNAIVVEAQSVVFDGRKISPPFVVIRRTSNPSDRRRLVTSLILIDGPVAVENHLLVVEPISGGVKSCRYLLERLQSPDIANQLNEAIRCRHLTTKAIKDLLL